MSEKKEAEEEEYPISSHKVVLLGQTAVGKTCLISRFVSNIFLQNFVPTLGGTFHSKEIKYETIKKRIKLEIWDTAGQEKYRSITKMYYKDASAAIIVYDITRRDTFEEIKNFWIDEVKENAPEGLLIFIVGNKSDYYEYEEVPKKEAEDFAKSIKSEFKETSAKEGTGVEELFYEIGLKILEPENFEKLLKQIQKDARRSIIITDAKEGKDAKNPNETSKFIGKYKEENEEKKCC